MMDPYSVLGVSKTASQDDIKAAYRKLAKKLHPDLNPGNKEIENKFKEVNRAYELIGTEEERAKFDRGEASEHETRKHGFTGERPFYYYQTQGPGSRYSGHFEGFDPDIFADLFGERGPHRGRDQYYSLEIDFNTSILGGEREITLPTGKKLQIKIPAGVKPGTKLRLAGQGEGDTYVEIRVRPSHLFKRNGDDIEIELPLSLNETVLGGEVQVPTVDGRVVVKVPRGLSTGARIRIKGKGVPTKHGRGDQFAVVKIVSPPRIDADLEKFMKEWSKDHAYNPREEFGREK